VAGKRHELLAASWLGHNHHASPLKALRAPLTPLARRPRESQGEYLGLPPTGKSVTYGEIIIFRFVNGRIAETWGVIDVFSQMKQLGMIPA
jgi:hypothetical protein